MIDAFPLPHIQRWPNWRKTVKAIDEGLDIPEALKEENRVPLTPAQQKKVEQVDAQSQSQT